MRVLIAEDEALIRMDLREMLEEEGHEVVGEARDGAEAIALARALAPDVVFMDINMPGVNGIEAAEVIGDERIAPVVMVTAFSQAAYVEQAAAAGAMAYVVKPFTRTDIMPAMALAAARFAEAVALWPTRSRTSSERLETRKVVDRAKGILMARGMSRARGVQATAEARDGQAQDAARDRRGRRSSPPRPRGSAQIAVAGGCSAPDDGSTCGATVCYDSEAI